MRFLPPNGLRPQGILGLGFGIGGLGICAIYHFEVAPLHHWAWILAGLLAGVLTLAVPLARLLPPAESWLRQRRILTVALAAIAAVATSCYPVIFCGRSFAGPGYGHVPLLYESESVLPGLPAVSTPNQGADIGILPWALAPNQFAVQRSLFRDHEFPFWNRYASSGTMLLGQMQSGVGDPLQLLVWLGQGAAWSWDLKYLGAKLLFCFCLGVLVLRIVQDLSAAVFVTFSSAFIGAFMRTYNHPEFFVLTTAPLIWLTAEKFLAASGWRQSGWALGWGAACMAALYSGAVKGGASSCALMTLAGAMCVAGANQPRPRIALWPAAGLIACLMAINVPLAWPFVLFRDAVYHGSDIPASAQPPHQLLGLFDYMFFREPAYGTPIAPAHLLDLPFVLLGCMSVIGRNRPAQPKCVAVLTLVLIGIVFGPELSRGIQRIPMLGRVGHIDRDLSYLLAGVFLPILAGVGLSWLRKGATDRRGALICAAAAVVAAALLVIQGRDEPRSLWHSSYAPYADVTLVCAFLATVVVAVAQRFCLVPASVAVVAALAAGSPAFVRNTFIHRYSWGKFFMVPGRRPDLTRSTPALDALRIPADSPEYPGRVLGARATLMGNYPAIWELEVIGGDNPMNNHRYEAWLDASGEFPVPRVGGWVTYLDNPADAHPLLNVLNVRRVARMPNAGPVPGFPTLANADLLVAENKQAWPRAFFAPGALVAEDDAQFWGLARRFQAAPFVAVTSEELNRFDEVPPIEPPEITPAQNYHLTSNRTAFDLKASKAGWALLSEAYFPGHVRATINGRQAPIERANGALEALRIPRAGDYHIEFQYVPDHWDWAVAIGVAGAGGLLVLAVGISAADVGLTAFFGSSRPAFVASEKERRLSTPATARLLPILRIAGSPNENDHHRLRDHWATDKVVS